MLLPVLIAYVLFPDTTTQLLAQAGNAASEAAPYLTLANLGLAGLGLWLFATGKIHSDRELQRVISRCDTEFQRIAGKLDAAEAELRERNAEALTTIVPTLTRALLMLGRFADQSDSTPPPKGRP